MLGVLATVGDPAPVIVITVKEPDWPLANVVLVDEPTIAGRVEGNKRGKFQSRCRIGPLKTAQARIQRNETSFGKSHQRNPRGINPGIFRYDRKRPIGIDD